MRASTVIAVFMAIGIIMASTFTIAASAAYQPVAKDTNFSSSSQGGGLYPIYLVEHNLPGGMLWYAYIGPQSASYYSQTPHSSTTPVVEFQEASGTYSFSVGANGPYMPENSNIYATVVDKAVTVNIFFVEQYNVSVTEVGIPQGYNWELSLANVSNPDNNGGVSGPPFRSTQWTYVPSGTYSLQLGSSPALGVSILGTVGNITVTNGPVHKTVRFYEVNITKEGLPANFTEWGFHYGYYGSYSNGTQFSRSGYYPNTTGPITLYLPNATYSIHPVSKGYYSPPLRFTVNGEPLNLTEPFRSTYRVTFVEHNLTGSDADYWEVHGFPTAYGVGSPYAVASALETFSVPNGTFSYNVTGLYSYMAKINGTYYTVTATLENQNNSFTVNGSNIVVNLYFNNTLTPIKVNNNPAGPSSLYGIVAIMAIVIVSSIIVTIDYRRRHRR